MNIKKNFMMREVGGAAVVVALGKHAQKFGGIIKLNDTAAFLFKLFYEGTTHGAAADKLAQEYDIDAATAAQAVDKFLSDMASMNVLEK